MHFSQIKGNEAAVSALRAMVDNQRIPHAMLFHENPGCGAMSLAIAFLTYLNCEHPVNGDSCGECPSCRQMAKLVHPDVHYVFPVNTGDVIKGDHPVSDMGVKEFRAMVLDNPYFTEQDLYAALGIESKSGNISVFEAKEIISKLSLSSVTGSYKSIVMFLPERMNPAAANKLLKILEEPPAQTNFILICHNPQEVMKTIYSRCQLMRVLPPDRSALAGESASGEIVQIWNDLLSALLSRNLMQCLECADRLDALKSREKQKNFCAFAATRLRNIFLQSRRLGELCFKVDDNPDSASVDAAAAAGLPAKFYTRAVANLDRAAMLLGRNVSAKMVFTDLVNHFYVNVQ